jgi:hypothetical protein
VQPAKDVTPRDIVAMLRKMRPGARAPLFRVSCSISTGSADRATKRRQDSGSFRVVRRGR